MYGSVPVVTKRIEDYRAIVGDEKVEEILGLASFLEGARVLHVNSTAFGGGVAEILGTLVPLMRDVGLKADWQVIRGADEFFNVTKVMHNALQSMDLDWTEERQEVWMRYNKMNADLFDEDYDFVVIHDPQPAGMLSILSGRNGWRKHGKWIWRCHIDITNAQPAVWDFLRPHVEAYDAGIFTLPEYVKEDLKGIKVAVIPPAIDPLSPKNMDIPWETVETIVRRYGVSLDRPIICQVSRFDPWKDPLGVIDAYRKVKAEVPDVQLVMIASMAADDPEGWSYYERTARRAGEDSDIYLLSNLQGVGNLEVNAFQRAATVVVQKSVREGFGLVVAEGLWKGKPVVAGNVGGIPLQVIPERTGYLVDSVEECAEWILFLLQRPDIAEAVGREGREHVREHFLVTRNLRDYLTLFLDLQNGDRRPLRSPAAAREVRSLAGSRR